jgi:hypothetical protein
MRPRPGNWRGFKFVWCKACTGAALERPDNTSLYQYQTRDHVPIPSREDPAKSITDSKPEFREHLRRDNDNELPATIFRVCYSKWVMVHP